MDSDVKERYRNMGGENSTHTTSASTEGKVNPRPVDVIRARPRNGVIPKDASNHVTGKSKAGVRTAGDIGQTDGPREDDDKNQKRDLSDIRESRRSRDMAEQNVLQVRFELCPNNEVHSVTTHPSNVVSSAGVKKKQRSKHTSTRKTDVVDANTKPISPPPPPLSPPPSNTTKIPKFHARDHKNSLTANTDAEKPKTHIKTPKTEDTNAKQPSQKPKTRKPSAKDEEVRRLALSMAGSIENLIGNLHGIVGDLRQLVLQIDAVTDSIDNNCRPRATQGCNEAAAESLACSTPAGSDGRRAAVDLRHKVGRTQAKSSHRFSYPQYSQCSVSSRPSSELLETDRSMHKHYSRSSKRARDLCRAPLRGEAKPADHPEKHLHSVIGEVGEIFPEEKKSRSVRAQRRHKSHRSSSCAQGAKNNGAIPDVSNYSPDSSAELIPDQPPPTFTPPAVLTSRAAFTPTALAPFKALTYLTALTPPEAPTSPAALTPSEVRTSPTVFTPTALTPPEALTSPAALTPPEVLTSSTVFTPTALTPREALPSPAAFTLPFLGAFRDDKAKNVDSLPDMSLKNWREMMEQHCGSAESLTPQIDWSYLALTDHNPHSTVTDRLRVTDHKPQPACPQSAGSPKLDVASQGCAQAQPQKKDWSRLALTGLKIKHQLVAISGISKEREPIAAASDRKSDRTFLDAEPSTDASYSKVRGAIPDVKARRGAGNASVAPQSSTGVFSLAEQSRGRTSLARNNAGVFPHAQQGVGGAPLGWNASNKALPDWPSGDLSSIGASDNEVDDLSSPYLPQHFQFPRRSSAVESSPELDFKEIDAARLSTASSVADSFQESSVLDSSPEQNFKEVDTRMSGASSVSDTVVSGGFEVRPDAEMSPGSDITVSYGGHYESAMETRLEQLSTEVDGSDFSDADADAGSDVLEQSLTSLETASVKYDRDVNTWKSYTMTHIDSDDVVSDCTSDILNENFLDTATANPGFDDVNLNFDDVNFPSLAY